MSTNPKKTFLTAGLALFTTLALAQPYSIDWSTIDGGGGTNTLVLAENSFTADPASIKFIRVELK